MHDKLHGARQALARSYTWAYVGLRLAGRLAHPALYFDNESVRFERRLEVGSL